MGFTTWDIVRALLLAARWTVLLSVITLIGGGVVGLIILSLRTGAGKVGKALTIVYIEVFQGTPLLMQLFLAYFGVSMLSFDIPAWAAAAITLTLWASAFLAEIWRGCVEAIDRGQWEASASLGMGYIEQLYHIILPQALRIAIPPTVGFSVQIIKGTALTSIIGFVELSRAGSAITNATYNPTLVYGLVACFYFAMCWPLSKGSQVLERRLNAPHHR